MVKISIDIDVQNPHDIVKQREGKWKGWLARTLMSRKKLKNVVEKEVARKVAKGLEDKLEDELEKEGVIAQIKVDLFSNGKED
ncbi:hypothetical protein [Xanthovirga aplysinae]|uniref:hypothetical protein n=1 Tax=Xanthovirga aplysinae TaxID=2529853 RepID=UPI0012BC0C47|nr:hypothetical protein [Xanthovirga aplysinae]MTI30605.1 hypothetical protein [Xanthovirga aplysinae]